MGRLAELSKISLAPSRVTNGCGWSFFRFAYLSYICELVSDCDVAVEYALQFRGDGVEKIPKTRLILVNQLPAKV
jgi:hypothetical protein